MLKLLIFIWMLPQNLIGLLIILLYKAQKYEIYRGCVVYQISSKFLSGGSLGRYIVLEDAYFAHPDKAFNTIKHEYGHYRQGLIFGPLYLLVIGLPSVINNLISRKDKQYRKNYYKRYPEKWADTLGGVKR